MLSPRRDRLDYSALLVPPQGMQLKQAIGTTYSLDLDAFLSIPLALAFHQEPKENLCEDKVLMLSAIRRVADKITLFCNKGAISVPRNLDGAIGLHALLEDTLTQIALPTYKSFHAKIWVLWFEDPKSKEQRFRVLVLSRNLTFDRSWDAAVCLEGQVAAAGPVRQEIEQNKPLIDFLRWLDKQNQKVNYNALVDALWHTRLQPQDGPVAGLSFQFFPIGIYGYAQYKLPMENCRRQAVLSPFLSANELSQYLKLAEPGQTLLFARADQLSQIWQAKPAALQDVPAYVVSDQAYAGEMSAENELEPGEEARAQDLHAKVYIQEFPKKSEAWLGSANLTRNAFYGNVEFMLRLTGKPDLFQADQLRQELLDESNLFEPWNAKLPNPEAAETCRLEQEVRAALQGVLAAGFSACAVKRDNYYQLQLTVEDYGHGDSSGNGGGNARITLAPLGLREKQPIRNGQLVFEPFQIENLTQYYVITIQVESMIRQSVIKVETANLPEGRLQAVVASIIRDQDDFLRHLAILLADPEHMSEFIGDQAGQLAGPSRLTTARQKFAEQPLYEQLLKMASREPYRLAWVEQDVALLAERGENVIPAEFTQLWQSFQPYVNGRNKKRHG